jgi:hypothetical protein
MIFISLYGLEDPAEAARFITEEFDHRAKLVTETTVNGTCAAIMVPDQQMVTAEQVQEVLGLSWGYVQASDGGAAGLNSDGDVIWTGRHIDPDTNYEGILPDMTISYKFPSGLTLEYGATEEHV